MQIKAIFCFRLPQKGIKYLNVKVHYLKNYDSNMAIEGDKTKDRRDVKDLVHRLSSVLTSETIKPAIRTD